MLTNRCLWRFRPLGIWALRACVLRALNLRDTSWSAFNYYLDSRDSAVPSRLFPIPPQDTPKGDSSIPVEVNGLFLWLRPSEQRTKCPDSPWYRYNTILYGELQLLAFPMQIQNSSVNLQWIFLMTVMYIRNTVNLMHIATADKCIRAYMQLNCPERIYSYVYYFYCFPIQGISLYLFEWNTQYMYTLLCHSIGCGVHSKIGLMNGVMGQVVMT